MRKRILLYGHCVFFPVLFFQCPAQNTKIHKLDSLINIAETDTGRISLNLNLNKIDVLAAINLDSAINPASKILGASQKMRELSLPDPPALAKYKPIVTITFKSLGDKIEISVSDNGNGMPEEIKDKIYQPFFITKPTGQGTGLGLSMSYDIITKGHGGVLTLETEEGVSMEFIIQLPL